MTADDLDKEADSVTETVESRTDEFEGKPEPVEEESTEPQRCADQGRADADSRAGTPPAGGGRPLDPMTRAAYERYFDHDFAATRIHADAEATDLTTRLGAVAATSGNNVYFNHPVRVNDAWLLAHELTHVVQQGAAPPLSGSDRGGTRSGTDLENEADAAASAFVNGGSVRPIGRTTERYQHYRATICRRPSTQPRDFPSTYINRVDVSLADQRVTLRWTGPSAGAQPSGPFNCSTGAGVCGQTSCNDVAHSRTENTCCTPIGEWPVHGYSCRTPRLSLENFVAFQRDGIGLHFYPSVPRVPASHGCVRLGRRASELVYDSTRVGTIIAVAGTARGHRCHRSCS